MFRVKLCREIALKILYQLDLSSEWELPQLTLRQMAGELARTSRAEEDFLIGVVEIVRAGRAEIDALISKHLVAWKLERLNVIDRNIMRLGAGEQRLNGNRLIVIDEMVRLAKKYGESDSYRLINAVLDKILA